MLKGLINKIFNNTRKAVAFSAARTSSGEFLLKKTDLGRVHVEYAVVQKIAARALSGLEGINAVEVSVEKVSSNVTPMKIQLITELAEGYSAPKVAERADKAINDALKNFMLADFYVPVEVRVKQIKQAAPQRRRVR